MRFHNLEHLEHQGSRKLFRSEGLKIFICAACNYVICVECTYTFAEASHLLKGENRTHFVAKITLIDWPLKGFGCAIVKRLQLLKM